MIKGACLTFDSLQRRGFQLFNTLMFFYVEFNESSEHLFLHYKVTFPTRSDVFIYNESVVGDTHIPLEVLRCWSLESYDKMLKRNA